MHTESASSQLASSNGPMVFCPPSYGPPLGGATMQTESARSPTVSPNRPMVFGRAPLIWHTVDHPSISSLRRVGIFYSQRTPKKPSHTGQNG